MLTQDRLKELMSYDQSTGLFVWINNSSKYGRCRIGSIVEFKHTKGYVCTRINGKSYKLHRLAWFYMYGEWPKYNIDHINGVRDDNRIENLRDLNPAENSQNQRKAHIDNKYGGLLGVSYRKQDGKYTASIWTNKVRKHLGHFDTKEDAHNAYLKAKRELHTSCTI